jgi:hypothetical protein
VANDGLLVEGVGIRVIEGCACRNQDVGHGLIGKCACAELNAGWIDTLFLDQVLTSVECALGRGLRLLARRRVPDHHEVGVSLLREGEGDVIEAALGFVVDAYGSTTVACKAEAAQRLGLGDDGDDRRGDDDVGGRRGRLA